MTNVSKRYLEPKRRHKSFGEHENFLKRINKTLYYGKLPISDRLSLPVTEYASEIFSQVQYGRSLERLHCDVAASISRNACISPCSLVLALMYLDRLKVCNPEYLNRKAPSELFLVSLMVSTKFLNDDGEESGVITDEWAASAGVTVHELVCMEKEFLNAIQWEVFVSEQAFWSRLNELEKIIALRQSRNRGGWFTYTELLILLDDIEINSLINYLTTITTVTVVSYAASFLTILGSVLLASQVPGTPLYDRNQLALDDNIALTSVQSMKSSKVYDPVNILTDLILTTIDSNNKNDTSNDYHTNTTDSNWDWWTSDLMNWLYEYSAREYSDKSNIVHQISNKLDYGKRLDMSIANVKLLNCEDQIHKASSVRIQDQLENSWHKEWTDTFLHRFIKTYNKFIIHSTISLTLF